MYAVTLCFWETTFSIKYIILRDSCYVISLLGKNSQTLKSYDEKSGMTLCCTPGGIHEIASLAHIAELLLLLMLLIFQYSSYFQSKSLFDQQNIRSDFVVLFTRDSTLFIENCHWNM